MSQSNWVILILVLVAALVYGAYLLGRASALSETRRGAATQPEPLPQPSSTGSIAPRSPTAAPPPVFAGGDRAPAGSASASPQPHRGTAPPPAASAGNASTAPSPSGAPKRTAAPPPAQAAWSKPNGDGKG